MTKGTIANAADKPTNNEHSQVPAAGRRTVDDRAYDVSRMRIAVFGAGGPTGRRLLEQGADAGYHMVAVTRRPDRIPESDRLTVAEADATDPSAVARVIAGCDAVLSAIGVPYSSEPITIYSTSAAYIIAAMEHHEVARLVVVSSAPLDPAYRASDSWFFTRVMEPLFMRRPGRTTYEDMRPMESLVKASKVEWTIVRSSWLFEADEVSKYRLTTNTPNGMYTARPDLAHAILAQLDDQEFIRQSVAVNTTQNTPRLVAQIWNENIRKSHRT